MTLPIAAILAAAQLISGGVQKVTDRRAAMRARNRAHEDAYREAAIQAAAHAGGDTFGARANQQNNQIDYQSALAQRQIANRPINYGSIGGLVSGVGGAIGNGPESKPETGDKVPGAVADGADQLNGSADVQNVGGRPITIGSPTPSDDAYEGYISPSRIQAPFVISGPDRGPMRRPTDEDWYGNYG